MLTPENILNRKASGGMLAFLMRIYDHSRIWTVNHVLRTVTGIVIVLGNLDAFYLRHNEGNIMLALQHMTFICTYYGTVWAVFVSAAYANDQILVSASRTVAVIMMRSNSPELSRECKNLLYSMKELNRGFTVGGVTIHMEKAISIGSLIASAMVALVKLHEKQAIQ